MLILASVSPARKALLSGAGLAFEVVPPGVDERAVEAALTADDAAQRAKTLAGGKAVAVAACRPDSVVIGADQTLDLDGMILHKPRTTEMAIAQLDRLRGRTHRLHAGVALARDGRVVWSGVETAELTMRDFSAAERDQVLALEGDAVLSSVGAYRLEGASIRLFDKIEGDYFTILGLPLLAVLAALRRYAPNEYAVP